MAFNFVWFLQWRSVKTSSKEVCQSSTETWFSSKFYLFRAVFTCLWVLKLIQSFSSLALLWYVIDLKSLLLLVILSKVKLKPIMLHSQKDLILGSQELPSDSRTCNTLVAPWFNDPNNRQVHPQHHRSIRHTLAQRVLNSLWLLTMAQQFIWLMKLVCGIFTGKVYRI